MTVDDTTARARPALGPADLAALYTGDPSPQMRAALWEIRRLHAIQYETFRALELCLTSPQQGRTAAYYLLDERLRVEPAIVAALDREWQDRGSPSNRYYDLRDEAERPVYRTPRQKD